MNENLKTIMKAASEDDELMGEATALVNELNAATDEARPEIAARIVALANERGFVLTEDDLLIETPAEGQLEDEELAAVSGGCSDDLHEYCGSLAY